MNKYQQQIVNRCYEEFKDIRETLSSIGGCVVAEQLRKLQLTVGLITDNEVKQRVGVPKYKGIKKYNNPHHRVKLLDHFYKSMNSRKFDSMLTLYRLETNKGELILTATDMKDAIDIAREYEYKADVDYIDHREVEFKKSNKELKIYKIHDHEEGKNWEFKTAYYKGDKLNEDKKATF